MRPWKWDELAMFHADGGAGSRYVAAMLALGPDAYYRLAEPSGAIMADLMAAHTGVYVGGPTLGIPGAVNDGNAAVLFDGTINQYGKVAAYLTIPAPPVSLVCWTRQVGVPNDTSLGGWFSALGVLGLQLYCSGPGVPPTTNIRIGTETGNANADCDLSNGLWHMLGGTIDAGANARLYFDGGLVNGPNPTAFPGGASINPFKIGTYGADGSHNSWPGGVDEFGVFSRELTAADMLTLFNAAQ